MTNTSFASRHIGPQTKDIKSMLNTVGYDSVEQLIAATIPRSIRLENDLNLEKALSEHEYLEHIHALAKKNDIYKSFIGQGYYPTLVPSVILRNVLENPGWYTAYTPYQSEISQGRLEALLNFQTMISDLTGMKIANASLLDEATAAAEAMIMFRNARTRSKTKAGANKFFVDYDVFLQTKDVLKTRAMSLNIELVFGDYNTQQLDDDFFGALVQFPAASGSIEDYSQFIKSAHDKEVNVVVVADLLSLALLTPPGEWKADAVVGSSQRFGVPMGYGGPHAAFFATQEKFKRVIPGRIIGVSKDKHGNSGYRMALQTREQHIRREKATSNICTAQALLAVMASMYAVYHGAEGIKCIAQDIHEKTRRLEKSLTQAGIEVLNKVFFDTLTIRVKNIDVVKDRAQEKKLNFFFKENEILILSLFEGVHEKDLTDILYCLTGETRSLADAESLDFGSLSRTSDFLTHPVFNTYRSETEMMRYLKRLENKDLSLVHSMISLGSCTMKLNAATELMPITWPEFSDIHPFAPKNQTAGFRKMVDDFESILCEITGFSGISFQPNSGAQGEYTGLLVIRAYHHSRGNDHRNICLIPSSAHGTNPASAMMAGMKVVIVKCDDEGNVDLTDLEEKASAHSDNLAALMITYPSTHGVFEEDILRINELIHNNGGQVYMDGANMNAQVGLTNPGRIGADVCHLNLHKTFAIPHGGGGPGVGPIGVAEHLKPFLPGNPVVACGGDQAISSVSAAPWGSGLILLISYGYVKMLGKDGLKKSTEFAILNANYMRELLGQHYPVLYKGKNGTVAHEMILDCRSFKTLYHIEAEDIAKRLIDYGFHAPTVSFPVSGTLMIEPTESESKEELDKFCDALIAIRKEIEEVANHEADPFDNVLKNAPHTVGEVTSDDWSHSYSRKKAAYPIEYLQEFKFWAPVGRIDNAFGDRNLICTCPSTEEYERLALEEH